LLFFSKKSKRAFALTFMGMLLFACQQSPYPESDLPIVKMSTAYGDFFIALETKNAPITTKNFLRYVDGNHFNDLGFYRNVTHQTDNHPLKIAVLQGGLNADFDDFFAPAFASIAHESTKLTGLSHTRGSISMARGKLGTAQTEFFISTLDNAALDAGSLRLADGQGFAVFGHVIAGMEIVDAIANLPATKAHHDPYVKGQILNELVVVEVSRVN
jgi:peptidyl-prolyl cis-trans isomerase A (cyclophilin A)